MRSFDELVLSENSEHILIALQSVDCGQEVFDALNQVPTDNLNDMRKMIIQILKQRG